MGPAVRGFRDATGMLLLASASGCVPAPSYQGIGSLQPSGENPIIAPTAVRWSVCERPARPSDDSALEPQPTNRQAPDPPPITALSIGPACVVVGTGHTEGFQAFPGQECTLTFPEGSRRIRVEGFWVGSAWRSTVNDSIVIDMRGADVATGHYALYHFEGAGDSSDAAPADPCEASPLAHPRPGLVARP
jgi:hypothetical protein